MQTGLTLECRVQHPFRTDKAASKNAEKLHAVFICYELCQKSRQAVADIENAMKIIIAEQASCPREQVYMVRRAGNSISLTPVKGSAEFPRIDRRF